MSSFSCRTSGVACAVVIAVLSASSASALELSKPKGIIQASLGLPSAPSAFSDGTSLGIGGGIGLGVDITSSVMLQAGVEYTTFGADENGLRKVYGQAEEVGVVGGETSLLYAAATVRVIVLRVPGIRGYVSGGAGFFRNAPDNVQFDNKITEREAENTVGFHGGVGVDVPIGSLINIFAEGTYVGGATTSANTVYIPLRLGITFELSAQPAESRRTSGR